jgi:hypothetical protein
VGMAVFGTGQAGTPTRMWPALAVIGLALFAMTLIAPVLLAVLLRGWLARSGKPPAVRPSLGDPWVDGVPLEPVEKGLSRR